MTLVALVLILGLALVGWATARARAAALSGPVHSLPGQHGAHTALWVLGPALLLLAGWHVAQPGLVLGAVERDAAAGLLPAQPVERAAVLAEARALAGGREGAAFHDEAPRLAPVFASAERRYGLIGAGLALLAGLAGGGLALARVRPDFRARTQVERLVMACLVAASLIAILTTLGIVASLLFESLRFFARVSPVEFLTGLAWSPQGAAPSGAGGAFGAVPLFWGTIFIGAIIAMIVAVPLGLMSAIYLTQYASPRLRRWMKPALEVLAGVPSVVYGYFAALSIAPAIRVIGQSLGIAGASSESALAAGLVMGVMLIPFVSSMADDSIAAVPQSMRDGSLALGATPSETIARVLVPAALPGIVGGVLLAVSRAIGETMIVVMAAGLAANLTANPFASVTTVTVQIVQLLTGDQEFDSAKTLAAFALGLILFLVTLALNVAALVVVKRYREAYD